MPNKFYITTAIDYANAKPHIGHALEKIQADVIARYRRIKGDEVWFVTGTDEHGAKIVRAADVAGKSPRDFVNEYAEYFQALKQTLNLSWDDFIRTSDSKRHWPGAQKLWLKLHEAGDLYKKKYRGLYCVGHEAFVTEKDLVDGKCRDHQKEPEVVEEENWFFRLSKYGPQIKKVIETDELKIFPRGRKHEILSLIENGLEDVSFSRPRKDLSWGIPVPNDPEHTMYVWCDALASYLTAIGYGQNSDFRIRNLEFSDWWPADVHVIGKDILRFHAAIWPAMLLSTGLKLPKSIFVHGMIAVSGQKMSKTVGNVIDQVELVKKYGTDAVRYFLLREIPSGEDGDFSYEKLEERYNGDLANGIGNLTARVATLGEKISPLQWNFESDIEDAIKKETERALSAYEKYMKEIRLNDALAVAWELISFSDKYINEKKPWAVSDENALRTIIANAGYCIGTIANLLLPFLPETAEKIRQQILFEDSALKIKKGGNLFPRLT
ncbi:class I tRNA ligase family protein [Patescibacteria group bacterium]|nr:class I tRNA ligase family protein [Patescibacteria group bacterium]